MRRAQLRSDPFADNAAHLPGALRGAIKFIVDQGTEVPAIRERQRAFLDSAATKLAPLTVTI